ncbi:MAG: hypothetical protein Q7R43_01315 [Candidatus Daviesbacteria bacterium]|nr:hypothetical protein [Candidatus Daviesbacteria bacterium]
MEVFDRERPEANKAYSPPEGTPVERKMDTSLGIFTAYPKIEVRGGTWLHYSQQQFNKVGLEGVYVTREINVEGFQVNTLYRVKSNGSINIGRLRFKIIEGETIFEDEPMNFFNKPRGEYAKVTLETVPSTAQEQPVLRYTEVTSTLAHLFDRTIYPYYPSIKTVSDKYLKDKSGCNTSLIPSSKLGTDSKFETNFYLIPKKPNNIDVDPIIEIEKFLYSNRDKRDSLKEFPEFFRFNNIDKHRLP